MPISPNIFLNKKSHVETVVFGVYQQRKFASEDSFGFLILSSAADAVQILME